MEEGEIDKTQRESDGEKDRERKNRERERERERVGKIVYFVLCMVQDWCRLELQAKLNGREGFSVDARISFRRGGRMGIRISM